MKTRFGIVFCIVFYGCTFTYENNVHNDASLEQLKQENDSLKDAINALKKQTTNADTLTNKTLITTAEITASVKDTIGIKHPLPKVTPKSKEQTKKSDTTYYFYTHTKKVSVKMDPGTSYGKRKIRFYNPKGEVMFEQDDVHMSYSISTEIKEFHPNGAVKRIVIHMNPGASMHWYETIISFDTDNTPLWKEEITYPITLDNMMDNKSYWDAAKKQWIKQEAVIEQPYVK